MTGTGEVRAPEPPPAQVPWRALPLAAVSLALAAMLLWRAASSDGLTIIGSLVLLASLIGFLESAFQFWTRSPGGLASAIARGGATGTWAAVLLSATGMSVLLAVFHDHVVDDSYITYRYAQHLARGLGVVWNPGEAPVEGYSNFLWMVVHAAGMQAGTDPLALSRLLGVLCHAACGLMMFRLARALGAEFGHAVLPAILFSLVPAFPFWAMSGLESSSAVLFALLFFHGLAVELPADRWPWRTASWGLALVLSRPDGLFLVGLALASLVWPLDDRRRGWLVRCVTLLGPPVALYQLWRQLTFGTQVPNTVSAKFHALAGLHLVVDFFAYAFPLLLLIAWRARLRGLGQVERAIVVATAGYMAAALNISPHVGHAHRFFLPVLAPLLAVAALGMREGSGIRAEGSRWGARIAVALVALYAILPALRLANHAHLETRSLREAHWVVAKALGRTFGPGDLLAASDCGVIPYGSGMRTLDLWGLNDAAIATRGFSAAQVMDAGPSAIVLHSLDQDTFQGRESYDRELYPLVQADSAYRLVDRRPLAGYTLWVFSTRPLR